MATDPLAPAKGAARRTSVRQGDTQIDVEYRTPDEIAALEAAEGRAAARTAGTFKKFLRPSVGKGIPGGGTLGGFGL